MKNSDVRRIFFDSKSIVTGSSNSHCHSRIQVSGDTTLESILSMVDKCPEEGVIAAVPLAGADVYKHICSLFKEVNAGGGLVRNDRDDCLLIKRNGLWDLPKGHQETGEDIRETSVREVMEETGIPRPECGDLICITDHCYLRNGIWHLKHTWWFDMKCREGSFLSPQTEECISEAVWADREAVIDCMKNTYGSIVEVLEKAFARTETK